MDDERRLRKNDDKTGWGALGPGLALVVFAGIVVAAGATAFQIGKQQSAAQERQQTAQQRAADARQQLARQQLADLVGERDALRDRVLELETQLLAERSTRPQEHSTLRCINGELIARRGDTWTSAGRC